VKTSEVAKLFGVHPNTVRLYEEWGYLPPIPRDSSGQRAFTEKHVEQIRLVRHTLHNAPRSGLQIKESYKELVWLACAGHVQLAITQTHKHLAVVKLARERAQNAHDFLGETARRVTTKSHFAARRLLQLAPYFVAWFRFLI
jgi:DNA-binding transcriptional MerR regulator